MRYECEFCGLADTDLPDGVDPEFIFEPARNGDMACQACVMVGDAPDWFELPEDEEEEE